MARVTVEDCVDKVPNRFDLVMLASHRAREITAGSPPTVDRDNDKNPVVALREIAEETQPVDDLRERMIESTQTQIEVDEPEEDAMALLLGAEVTLACLVLGYPIAWLYQRSGSRVQTLIIMIVLLPLCCVYYPVAALPLWLHPVAWSLTPTYVFEGMRAVLLDGTFRTDLMIECLALNAVYLGLGFITFVALLQSARHKGGLLTMGE